MSFTIMSSSCSSTMIIFCHQPVTLQSYQLVNCLQHHAYSITVITASDLCHFNASLFSNHSLSIVSIVTIKSICCSFHCQVTLLSMSGHCKSTGQLLKLINSQSLYILKSKRNLKQTWMSWNQALSAGIEINLKCCNLYLNLQTSAWGTEM